MDQGDIAIIGSAAIIVAVLYLLGKFWRSWRRNRQVDQWQQLIQTLTERNEYLEAQIASMKRQHAQIQAEVDRLQQRIERAMYLRVPPDGSSSFCTNPYDMPDGRDTEDHSWDEFNKVSGDDNGKES